MFSSGAGRTCICMSCADIATSLSMLIVIDVTLLLVDMTVCAVCGISSML